jgi:hypothetical protein
MQHEWDEQKCISILVAKSEVNRPLGRPKHKKLNNIKTYLRETGWMGVDSMDLTRGRDQCKALVNTKINLTVP